MPLDAQERVRVAYHMGYAQHDHATDYRAAVPMDFTIRWALDKAMDEVKEAALPLLRTVVNRLDTTEEQLFSSQEILEAKVVGSITLNPGDHQKELRKAYRYWQGRLSAMLGCKFGPGAFRLAGGSALGATVL